jgi:hypothetical protein
MIQMKALIDTNVLYRLANVVPEGKYSRKKIIYELNKYNVVIISELSVYELFTRFRLNRKIIRKVLRYIKSNRPRYKIMPHPIEGFEPLEIVNLIVNNPRKNSQMMDIYGRVFSKKIFLEYSIIKYFIEALIVSFAIIIDEENPIKISPEQMGQFMQTVYIQVESFRDTMCSQLRTVLITFYSEDKRKSWFKNEMENILLPCLYVLSTQYILIQNGLNITQIDTMNDSQKEIIDQAISSNIAIMNILHRMNTNSGKIFERITLPVIERSLIMFEKEMIKSINKENILYYKEILKRIFIAGKKIEKNDIIDSEFLRYYNKNDIEIISLDGGFRNIVREFDKQYAQNMDAWENLVLKN